MAFSDSKYSLTPPGRLNLVTAHRRVGPADRSDVAPLHLMSVLESLAPVPGESLFLGVCEDGLPLLLDLNDPSPGAALILGDDHRTNRPLVSTLVASALTLNSPAEVGVDLITSSPEAFGALGDASAPLRLVDLDEDTLEDLIWFHVRRASRDRPEVGRGRMTLLVLDDLEAALLRLDGEALEALLWLVTAGASQGTWVIASFAVRKFRQLDDRLFHAFGTRLVGALPRQRFAAYLSGMPMEITAGLAPGVQYCATIRGELVRFWLPAFDYQPRIRTWLLRD